MKHIEFLFRMKKTIPFSTLLTSQFLAKAQPYWIHVQHECTDALKLSTILKLRRLMTN